MLTYLIENTYIVNVIKNDLYQRILLYCFLVFVTYVYNVRVYEPRIHSNFL